MSKKEEYASKFDIEQLVFALEGIGFREAGGGDTLRLMDREDCSIKVFVPTDVETGYISDFQFVISYNHIPVSWQKKKRKKKRATK